VIVHFIAVYFYTFESIFVFLNEICETYLAESFLAD